jgi:hypothetical protein
MNRDDICGAIRREAALRGGHVGIKAFVAATGIPEKQIIGKYWARWNDALAEAGVGAAKTFHRPRTEEAVVLEAMAQLAQRLGKAPSYAELSLERRREPSFPALNVITRARRSADFWGKVAAHCGVRPELSRAREVAEAQAAESGAGSIAGDRAPVVGYVYLLRSGRRYKIGRTNSPSRRHREVRLDLPDPTNLVHSIPTDDPQGIEAYWHGRFGDKRVRDTEFFSLDSTDVAAFKRRKYQ